MLPSNTSEWEAAHPSAKKSGGGRGRTIIGVVVLLVVLVGLIGLGIGWLGTLSTSRPTTAAPPAPIATAAPTAVSNTAGGASAASAPTSTAANGVPADPATQQAIQQVIQQSDQAQVQALSTSDMTVMHPEATDEFYTQQAKDTQDLIDNGVTAIKLINIEWGSITVDGNTATATCWETWSVTFDDGTSAQSRDRNIYTLVKDASGAWKIQADDHPDAQQGGSGSGAGSTAPATPAPGR
jgi:ketosteroid isomerase-like protein